MLIFGTDHEVIISTKRFLCTCFNMKDMGVADVILGIRIKRLNDNLIPTQSHYIEKILKIFNHFDCKHVSTPYILMKGE